MMKLFVEKRSNQGREILQAIPLKPEQIVRHMSGKLSSNLVHALSHWPHKAYVDLKDCRLFYYFKDDRSPIVQKNWEMGPDMFVGDEIKNESLKVE